MRNKPPCFSANPFRPTWPKIASLIEAARAKYAELSYAQRGLRTFFSGHLCRHPAGDYAGFGVGT